MFCVNCGKKLDEGGKFCPDCGTTVGGNVLQTKSVSDNVDISQVGMYKVMHIVTIICAVVMLVMSFDDWLMFGNPIVKTTCSPYALFAVGEKMGMQYLQAMGVVISIPNLAVNIVSTVYILMALMARNENSYSRPKHINFGQQGMITIAVLMVIAFLIVKLTSNDQEIYAKISFADRFYITGVLAVVNGFILISKYRDEYFKYIAKKREIERNVHKPELLKIAAKTVTAGNVDGWHCVRCDTMNDKTVQFCNGCGKYKYM